MSEVTPYYSSLPQTVWQKGKEIINAFANLFKNRQPKKLKTDKGKEFVKRNVQVYLRVIKFIGSHLKMNKKLKLLNG